MSRKICIILLAAVAALPLFAATHTWSGAASGNVSDTANWIGGSPAADPAADLDFPSGAANTNVANDLTSLTVHSIKFSGGTYTLSGNAISVTSSVTDSPGASATVACDLHLTSGLIVNAPSSLSSSTPKLAFTGAISGSGSVTIAGYVSFAGSQPNTYSGATLVAPTSSVAADLVLSKPDGVIAVPGDLTVDAVVGRRGAVEATTSGQISPNASVVVAGVLALAPGTTSTLHHLTFKYVGNEPPTLNDRGKVNLDSDITVIGTRGLYPEIELRGEVHISRTLTFDVGTADLVFSKITGTGGIDVRSGYVLAYGTFDGPATASGSQSFLTIHNPAVSLTVSDHASGGLGSAKSAVAQGATLATAGSGSVAENLTLDGASTFTVYPTDPGWDPAHPYVPATAGGVVTLGGAALQIITVRRAPGTIYTLIDNRGSAPVEGTFSGIPEGGTTSDGFFRISYRGGDGNDVVATDLRRIPTETLLRTGPPPLGPPNTLRSSVSPKGEYPLDIPLPAGDVTFTEDGVAIGTVPLNGNGANLIATPGLGRHIYKATYNGDATHEPSVSDVVTLTVQYPTPVLTSVSPTTVQAGGMVTLHLTGNEFYPTLTASPSATRRGIIHYISKTEATLELDLTKAAGTLHESIAVANDPSPDSNVLPLTITPRPVTITLADVDVVEPSGLVLTQVTQVVAQLAAPLPITISGFYSTTDGTARQGLDYIAVAAPFTIPAGKTAVALPITIKGDDGFESDETFTVSLSGISSVVATTNVATVTIHDDDRGLALLSISDAAVLEGGPGTSTKLKFQVTLTQGANGPVTVNYATSDGTATAPDDYLAAAGTLTFVPGEMTKTIEVVVNGDVQFESDEQLRVTLSNAAGAVLVRPVATGTILTDDLRRRAARH